MEAKVSGVVTLSFVIDKRGSPTDIQAGGDTSLTDEVKSAFRDIRFPRQCSGNQISIVIRFRIDHALRLGTRVAVNKIAETEYEVVSPAENVVAIVDPPATEIRPGSVPVQVWRVGDDGLTTKLRDALETAISNSRKFALSTGKQPGTLIVTIPDHVGWKESGDRTQIRYKVEFKTSDDVNIGQSQGACWEEETEKCADHILRDAKRVVGKTNPIVAP